VGEGLVPDDTQCGALNADYLQETMALRQSPQSNAAGIVVFFVSGSRQTARARARCTPREVEIALAELLDSQAHDHDTWDLFLGSPINDPHLEFHSPEVREHLAGISACAR
jgi:hypothetical protein